MARATVRSPRLALLAAAPSPPAAPVIDPLAVRAAAVAATVTGEDGGAVV
jgi:hypothetical protein